MIKQLIVTIAIVSSFYSHAQDNSVLEFKKANEYYAKGDYEEAIKKYVGILKSGQEASELYFNLGNAYYRTDKLGLAILNYEKAVKLAPFDEDIIANLELASHKTEDRIEQLPHSFLTSWMNNIGVLTNEKGWSVLFILLLTVSLLFFGFYLFSSRPLTKRVFFYTSFVVMLPAVFSFFFAWYQYSQLKKHQKAIVLVPATTVKSSPDSNATKLFVLHEGTKVVITKESDDWIELKLANGNVGWLPKKDLGEI